MKKIVMMLAVASIVSGAVWAQGWSATSLMPDWAPEFDAVQTESVEKHYSVGLFDSDVDNYIDPSFFDGQIGNFVFAGGFHDAPGTAFNTYGSAVSGPGTDTISLGWAKTLGEKTYLALYYGGCFVNAYGYNDRDSEEPDFFRSHAVWRNKLAVLFGIGSMGLRFDLIMNDTTDSFTTQDDTLASQTISNAPTLALGWGMNTGKIAPWAKVAFQLPETNFVTTTNEDGDIDKKATSYKDARIALNAGAWIGLNDTSSLSFDLTVGGQFPEEVKGDKETSLGETYTAGGKFGTDLYVDFTKDLTFGEYVTIKVKPNLGLNFANTSYKDSRNDEDPDPTNRFVLGAGIDIGGEYRYDKVGVYTGFGLRFFEWYLNGPRWEFRGLAWDPDAFGTNTGNLRFGLTFTPIEGLVVGTGLSMTAVTFNPATMQLTPGAIPASSTNNAGVNSVWGTTALSITVSYKFASKPKEPKEPKAEAVEATE